MSLIQDAETLEKARAVAARVMRSYHAGSDAWVAAAYLSDLLSEKESNRTVTDERQPRDEGADLCRRLL